MRHITVKLLHFAASLLLCVIVVLVKTPDAVAAEIPGFQKQVSLQAVDQSVPSFVESLFSQIGIPVKIESDIPGTVNGAFSGSADTVFQQIANAFNVQLYYDTSVAHVFQSDKIRSTILPLPQADAYKVAQSALEMGLPDSRNTIKAIAGGGLMVNGSTRFLEQIDSLAKAFNAQAKTIRPKKSPVVMRLFRLKYAWADDVALNVGGRSINIPGVATMLRTLISDDGTLPLAVGTSVQNNAYTLPKLNGQGLQAAGAPQVIQNHQSMRVISNGSANSNFSIVAQPQLNAVAIRDTADRMPLYEELIASLDVEPRMVEIEATIIDINVDRQRELGVNWRLQGTDAGFLVGDGSANDRLLGPGQDIAPQGRGGVLSLVLGDSTQFYARVKALEEEGAARIVSKPHVITLSNVEAVLGATTEFFVRVEGNEEVDLFNVPFGTTLRVTPHVFDEGANAGIKLLVNIEDGSPSGTQVDNIPVVERSTISTQALIREGASLLIGGMVREYESESEHKVPVLGGIPVVGNLFKSQRNKKTKTERLFMITPRIADSYQEHLQLKGPVLQGDPIDIITKAKRIREDESLAIKTKTRIAKEALRGSDANDSLNNLLLDEEMTMALLQVPTEPALTSEQTYEEWNQWVEVGHDAAVYQPEQPSKEEDVYIYDENDSRSTSYFERVHTRSQVKIAEVFQTTGEVMFTESVVPVGGLPDTVGETVQYVEMDLIGESANADEEIEELAAQITADLYSKRLVSPSSNNALSKIHRLKTIAPQHDYARNGERYIARLYGRMGRDAYKDNKYAEADYWLQKGLDIHTSAQGLAKLKADLGKVTE